jgi:thiol-disulfide isomerase/thioredoxin
MNEPKRNRNPLLAVVLLAVLAGAIGLYLFRMGTPPGPEGTQARGSMAAFLAKADRPAVPELAFKDASGADHTLGEWKGRAVLLNLWATWCAPCRKEMPALADLQKQLGSKDFEVVALSLDLKGLEASQKFLTETGAATLAVYTDQSTKSLAALQGVGLPLTVLIDKKGREIGRLIGPAEWNSPEAIAMIKAAVAEKP